MTNQTEVKWWEPFFVWRSMMFDLYSAEHRKQPATPEDDFNATVFAFRGAQALRLKTPSYEAVKNELFKGVGVQIVDFVPGISSFGMMSLLTSMLLARRL